MYKVSSRPVLWIELGKLFEKNNVDYFDLGLLYTEEGTVQCTEPVSTQATKPLTPLIEDHELNGTHRY